MKKRNPAAVLLIGFFTLGIYSWYWAVKTKGELNNSGAEHIPTAWIWLIPIVGTIWWYWKYSEGAEHVTSKEVSAVLAFILLWLLGPIGQAIMQNYYNKMAGAQAPAHTPSPDGNASSVVAAAPTLSPQTPAQEPSPVTSVAVPTPAPITPTTPTITPTEVGPSVTPPTTPPTNLVQ